MKATVKVAVFVIGILLTMLIQMALTSGNARASEEENALSAAVEQTLEQMASEKGYTIRTYEEVAADFHQRLLLQVSSDSDVKVEVLKADMEKGVLDVRVTERYRSLKGNQKEITCRKTVVLEAHDSTHAKQYRTIRFLAGDAVCSQYTAYDGSFLTSPETPEQEGKRFLYWKQEGKTEQADIAKLQVEGDMTFRAVFE